MISLENVSVRFGETTVLKNFSLNVEKGEHIAIMGPSGSGKTTVLKLISHQLKPSEGKVIVNTDNISYMFQEPRLVPWLTAAENVNLVLGDTAETLPTAVKWLQLVDLQDAIDKLPTALSGGMQQRTALARALAYDGELLLLDEPFSALDEALAEELLAVIKEYTKDKTVILVTHNSKHASMFADSIYVIKKQNSCFLYPKYFALLSYISKKRKVLHIRQIAVHPATQNLWDLPLAPVPRNRPYATRCA